MSTRPKSTPRVTGAAAGAWATGCNADFAVDFAAVSEALGAATAATLARMWRISLEWAGDAFGIAPRTTAAANVAAATPAATSRLPAMPNIFGYVAESLLWV